VDLCRRTWTGKALGTEVKLVVVTDDVGTGEESLLRAAEDLEETEQALSRFRSKSELGVLNREGTILAGPRLLTAVVASARAYEWSDGLLDPRVIDALEGFGYRGSLPEGDVGAVASRGPFGPADMRTWVDGTGGRITLPPGVRLDLAGVGKASASGGPPPGSRATLASWWTWAATSSPSGTTNGANPGGWPSPMTWSSASFRATPWRSPHRPPGSAPGGPGDVGRTTSSTREPARLRRANCRTPLSQRRASWRRIWPPSS
jgi:hypothetical protein